MKIFRILLAVAALFFFSNIGFAQSAKVVAKAQQKTEKLNAKIVSQDTELALTAEQREKIDALYAEFIMSTRKIKKSDATEEEMAEQKKAARKATNKQVNAVLTKEQKMAKKAARADKE